ncbi:hypothetical protein CONPUDRAFT_143627 [Coniophora puteana RWD-64-598 SS2]|uniref:Membrane anchor Opy2 N-terminal domain-containing protein n=1 Tax=Coniophora puteana (strain RWD-64-598) TaxID=741705 RepID=A0A5M3MU78_CONPW|nr:uncharacterized protein CONPUDRAFT_143627 [Coniophora puteana RWD-64-598 SS2]EIW82141.1 hypothetical protein CONPUDRAFT_143627 [Coniophora puteana RWD-64-598 SS2]
MLLDPRQCVSCPSPAPSCACATDESCQQISQNCQACATFTCVPTSTSSGSGGGGVSGGAVAGAAIAAILVLVGALIVYLLYRRRLRQQKAAAEAANPKDVPASAADVLNRPDPAEKPPSPPPVDQERLRVQSASSYQQSAQRLSRLSRGPSAVDHWGAPISIHNPFEDAESIQTTSSAAQGTNVIPIGLAPESTRESKRTSNTSSGPARPARAPDLTLNESGTPSTEHLPQPKAGRAQSIRSYMTNGSYSSEFLNEAPMIVTQSQRQVFGVVKAEVIHASGNSTPTSHLSQDSLKPPSNASRPSIRSPLAASSFAPSDSPDEAEEHDSSPRSRSGTDPFDDRNQRSPSSPTTTFGHSHGSESNSPSRPASVYTNAGSVIDIGSATRVNVGYTSGNSLGTVKSPMTAKARLLSPTSPSSQTSISTKQPGSLEEQQQRALAHAQARAHAQGGHGRRISAASSVVSTATRADSILESFPFVPPSPISSRPVRSPPRSPLNQQFTQNADQASAKDSQARTSPPSSAREDKRPESPLDPPPSRKMLGMSTASQLSTTSTGLGAFPFQIENENGNGSQSRPNSSAPQNVEGRQRASLDTLALMGDISAYPLGYDKEPMPQLPDRFKR